MPMTALKIELQNLKFEYGNGSITNWYVGVNSQAQSKKA